MTVKKLKVGVAAIIKEIQGRDALAIQLQELGFVPGSRLIVVSKTPFNGPMAIAIRGATIALRPEEARRIRI
jgi:ferrous iron transport protein A